MEEFKNKKEEKNFEIKYQGKIFEIISFEGKPGVTFEVALRSPGVRLLIEKEKDGQKALLMTKENRHEVGMDYRLPGGKVFNTLDELNKQKIEGKDINNFAKIAAQKEGKEEAGISAGEFEQIEVSKAGSSVEWDLYYFKVLNAEIGEQELEETEQGDIETILLSAEEIFYKLSKREIKEGRSADILWSWLKENGYIKFNLENK